MDKILFLIYVLLSISGMLLVKLGVAHPLNIIIKSNTFSVSAGFVTTLGLLLYIGSFLLWTKLVTLYDLSYFVPLATAITQVVVVILAIFIFKENFTLYKSIGVVLAIAGIIFMNIK